MITPEKDDYNNQKAIFDKAKREGQHVPLGGSHLEPGSHRNLKVPDLNKYKTLPPIGGSRPDTSRSDLSRAGEFILMCFRRG
jgi:hypothetical protein